MIKALLATSVAVAALSAASVAEAATINLSPYVNGDLTTVTSGWAYPQNGGAFTIGGITFALPTTANGKTGFHSNYNTPIAVGQSNVTEVYTIINSFTGTLGTTNGAIIFTNDVGQEVSFNLVQGINIRDHYNGSFNNVATDLFATHQFAGSVRYDVQRWVLGNSFGNLASMRLTSTGSGGWPVLQGATAVQAITSAVPEPATWAMMIGGFGVVGGAVRSGRRRVKVSFAA